MKIYISVQYSLLFHCSTIKNMWILSVFSCWNKFLFMQTRKKKIKIVAGAVAGEMEKKKKVISGLAHNHYNYDFIQRENYTIWRNDKGIRIKLQQQQQQAFSFLINREVVGGDYRVKIATYFSIQYVCVHLHAA